MTRNFVKEIIKSIKEEPHLWKVSVSGYTFNRKDGLEIWIANGKSYVKVYRPQRINLFFMEKRRLWRAITRRNISLNNVFSNW